MTGLVTGLVNRLWELAWRFDFDEENGRHKNSTLLDYRP
jgi:hypothetical protein